MNSLKLPKKQLLRGSDQILRLLNKGAARYYDNFTVKSLKNDFDFSRLIIIVRKHIAVAPKRNSLKRRFKESFRKNLEIKSKGLDIAIVCKKFFNNNQSSIDQAWLNL